MPSNDHRRHTAPLFAAAGWSRRDSRGRVYRDAGAADSQSMRQPAHAVSMDYQSVSRLRVRMRLLLRALYARFSRAARPDGLRAQDFRQADGGRGPVAHALAHANWHRRDRNRHGDRPVSTGRAEVWADALDARSFRAAPGTGSVDHNQIELDRSRPRAAA